jgi:beta-galactosidase
MRTQLSFTFLSFLFIFGCTTKPGETTKKSYADWYQVPTGKPAAIVFASYKTTMIANGTDEALLRISTVDSAGMEIMDATISFTISVKGDATILEMDHSEPDVVSKTDSLLVWKSQLSNGIKKLLLKSGTTMDKIKVEVKTDGMWPASHEIHTIPAHVELLKPTASQLKSSPKIKKEMIGADISFLPQLESRGMNFYDRGEKGDAIEILKKHGFNYIRLRIFVNPENEEGYSPSIGFCGLDSTLKMAKRVKEAGLNLLLDFHYSDTWADPQKQFKPKAWEGLAFEELTHTLKDYTKSVLFALKEQGTMPEMVQIGNEINHGIVWPDGHISNLDKLAELLKAGTQAVREVDPSTKVMMHLALGGQNEETVFWFDNMIARGLEFDIIGLSYYPRWHCTLDDLNNNMLDVIERYQKDVNVVEYSAFKWEVNELVFELPESRCNGTCIWEPLNTWSSVFDQHGNSLEEINLYDEISAKYLSDK